MTDDAILLAHFERDRERLRRVAFRILGSSDDADDAVQDAWLRVSRAGAAEIENISGWLTTIVARVALNMLQSRRSRREDPVGARIAEGLEPASDAGGPEDEALLADAVGMALLVVLDTLDPAERLVFVLHDMFAVSYEEIAPIVERSVAAARQLASRARRRVQGADDAAGVEGSRRRQVISAFLQASREGRFEDLLALLAPDVVLRVDGAAARMGAEPTSGRAAVAATFCGRAQAAEFSLVDGCPGAVVRINAAPRIAIEFVLDGDQILSIDLAADSNTLASMEFETVAG